MSFHAAVQPKSIQSSYTYEISSQQTTETNKEQVIETAELNTIEEQAHRILDLAFECVDFVGNDYSETAKAGMKKNLDRIREKGFFIEGPGDFRDSTVSLQGVLEHAIKELAVAHNFTIKMVVHTPMPCTPLCTRQDDPNLKALLNPQLLSNENNAFTVEKRTKTMRDILALNNSRVYIIYSNGGFANRTDEQQKVYLHEKNENKTTLIDCELSGVMDTRYCGATYTVETPNGVVCMGVDAPQANDVNADKWAIFCAPFGMPAIQERLQRLSKHLIENGGVDIRQELAPK